MDTTKASRSTQSFIKHPLSCYILHHFFMFNFRDFFLCPLMFVQQIYVVGLTRRYLIAFFFYYKNNFIPSICWIFSLVLKLIINLLFCSYTMSLIFNLHTPLVKWTYIYQQCRNRNENLLKISAQRVKYN